MSRRTTKSAPLHELQARRRVLGMSQEKFAERIDASVTAVRSWEQGWSTPMPRYRPAMADVLGVGLVELAHLLDPDGVPSLNGHAVPGWLSHYESLVLAAGRIGKVDLSIVPGLLQTRRYAEVVERSLPGTTGEQVSERVAARLARQSVLTREPEPLAFVAIISESVLLGQFGGAGVMAEQLTHLVELAERPSLDIRVVRADGRAACAVSGFELLARPGEHTPFMAVTFDVGGPSYHEGHKMAPFVSMFEHLSSVALSPFDSRNLIIKTREEYHR